MMAERSLETLNPLRRAVLHTTEACLVHLILKTSESVTVPLPPSPPQKHVLFLNGMCCSRLCV